MPQNAGNPGEQEFEQGQRSSDMDAKALLIFLAVGAIAGLLASLVVGGGGLLYYVIIGVIGSFVGGFLFSALKINIATGSVIANQIITSTIGAIIVVILARIIA